jgi:prepilin-type processing-associated H-X9-DG protein/prepilin-type N-terminal cleavage/methylation domain-containing protein
MLLSHAHHRLRSRRALSLVELLVVLGIVAVVMSVVLAAMSSVRQSARSTVCSASMREICAGMLSYWSSSNGYFLRTNDWPANNGFYEWQESVDPSLTVSKFRCPSFPTFNNFFGTYAYNARVVGPASSTILKWPKLPRSPSEVLLVGEMSQVNPRYALGEALWFGNPLLPDPSFNTDQEVWTIDWSTSTHGKGKSNYAYADGHVSQEPPKPLRIGINPLRIR